MGKRGAVIKKKYKHSQTCVQHLNLGLKEVAVVQKLLLFRGWSLKITFIIPLRAKQEGINFTPFVLSLPYANKIKKFKISHIDGGQLKNVCLLSVCCLSVVCVEFVPNYLLNHWSDWAKQFFTKTRENVYLGILILKFRGQHPRDKALG
jgi:hypothetical protein